MANANEATRNPGAPSAPEGTGKTPNGTGWRDNELASAIIAVTEGLIVLDAAGRIVRMNQTAMTLYGYTQERSALPIRERASGLRFESPEGRLIPVEELPGYRALKGETVMDEVFKFYRAGEEIPSWVAMNAAPIKGGDGSSMGAVVTFRNITRRMETETALRQTKEFLERLIDTSQCAVFVLDKNARFLTKNKACERITGYSVEEVVGRHYSEFVVEEYRPLAAEIFRQVFQEGRSVLEQEIPVINKDGSQRIFLMSAAPLRGAGDVTSVICSGVDISERKRLETELMQAKVQAESATLAKSLFLANMSHEIRTPMTGILGMTNLAIKSCSDEKALGFLHLAKQSGETLLTIINDILDLSKIEAGKVVLEMKRFSPRELLDQVLASFALSAQEKGLELTGSAEADVPEVLVGDPVRLRQILTNLVGNSIKFTKRGRVEVAVGCPADDQPGDGSALLAFAVRDTGMGIPPDKLEEIFESFSQAHVSQPEYGGTGLGLAISRRLVTMMGGHIRVESELDKGSAFFFTVRLDRLGEGEESRRSARATGRAAADQPMPRLRILVAEDNEVNQLLTLTILKREGHLVALARNGLEAIEALRREPFDLVFMDVRMPEMGGEEATRRIRSGEAGEDRKDIPIVALTAHALVGDKERFLALGMDDYLSKPMNPREITEVLERILARRLDGERRNRPTTP